MKTKKRPLSIYIHIPFCVRKCLYCDFLSAPASEEQRQRYFECLLQEIRRESVRYSDYEVQTVFIGGGTPSLLSTEQIQQLMETVFSSFYMAKENEITIEVNPGTADACKFEVYKKNGINRLSIGLQSANDNELRLLGRIHTYDAFLKTYRDAVKTGFNNINVDLMSAIPEQTMVSYRETLCKVLSLSPPPAHISAYSLIVEEGTPFFENTPILPDEETDREMYKMTHDILKNAGYHRYEISNYAKEGYECAHNKVYWKRGNYAGFGAGAASMVENVRFHNIRETGLYMDEIEKYRQDAKYEFLLKEDLQKLSTEEQMEEFMFLGLRLTEGIREEEFYRIFHKSIHEIYPGLMEKLVRQGLLLYKKESEGKGCMALSELGLDVSNVVMAQFLLS